MAIAKSILDRLDTQLAALETVTSLARPGAGTLDARPAPEEWSAREHLAHLARHATVFLERVDRILGEDRPALGRYRAEQDPEWPEWRGLPLAEALARLASAQTRLSAWARGLGDDDARRTAVHPAFGEMPVSHWLDFFLLHQAHHLYVAMIRVAEGRRPAEPAGE